jgi:hypothetical protein
MTQTVGAKSFEQAIEALTAAQVSQNAYVYMGDATYTKLPNQL